MSRTISETYELIAALRERGEAFCLVTVVRTADATSAKAGAKAVVTADGVLHGYVGGNCITAAARRVAGAVLRSGSPRLIRVKPERSVDRPVDGDGVELYPSFCPSGGTADLFVEPMNRRARIVVFGEAPVARALIALARAMGYDAVAVTFDDRPDNDPGVPREPGFADLPGPDLDAGDAVVVATQGRGDRQALEAALGCEAGYVGMVGSRRKIATLLDRLAPEIAALRGDRFHGPAGLAIGAIDPEEIALAILGEIVLWRRGGIRADAADDD